MSTSTRTRQYNRHRQRAAVRRRRIVLLFVAAIALSCVGAALAYPQLRGAVESPVIRWSVISSEVVGELSHDQFEAEWLEG